MNIWPFKKKEPAATTQLNLSSVGFLPFTNSGCIANSFDCGQEPLNKFIKGKAKRSQARAEFRTVVAQFDGQRECLGYYALQVGSDPVPETRKHKKSYVGGYSSFPAVNRSYLAVDRKYQGQGLGTLLLQDVFVRVAAMAEHVGFYALTVQAIDKQTGTFYSNLGFEEYVEGSQPKLLYPLQDILKLIEEDIE